MGGKKLQSKFTRIIAKKPMKAELQEEARVLELIGDADAASVDLDERAHAESTTRWGGTSVSW